MAQLTAPNANLQVGEWNHVAFTLDLEKKRVNLWVNKMNVASTAVEESFLPKFTNTNLLLGSDGTSRFHGLMDDVIIYERTVTDMELSKIMNYRNPELYLKSQLESYITFDRFRTNLDAEGLQIDDTVVVPGENVKDFMNKSVRIQSSNAEPISKTNDGIFTDTMSVGSWIKPQTLAEDAVIVSKEDVFSLEIKNGGEVAFSLGNEDPSDKRFVVEKEYRDSLIANTGSLRVPETTAARGQVTLSSGSYFANEFTVSMWFKVDEYSATRTLMSGMGFADDNKALCVEEGILYMYDAFDTVIAQVDNIITDKWYHLVFTDESLILNYRKYAYVKKPIWKSNDVLKLGNNWSNNKNFLGHIDEFVLYQKRLDFISIYDLYTGVYPKEYEAMVVVKYEFDDANTPGKDSSASQNDLTLSTATRETVPAFEFKKMSAPYKGPDGIVHTHYDFVNEVKDTSGNDNDPLSKTAISFVDSFNKVSYRAAEFDGSTSKIDCKPETLSELEDGFTASTWVQLPQVLTPNTRYPIFAQEGVMMAWLQTDESLNLSSRVYISPKTDFMIKETVWSESSVDVTMSIKSLATDRIFYAALLLKPLNLSLQEDVLTLNNALIEIGVAEQSTSVVDYTFTLNEARGIDGTMYPVNTVNNAYLYMRAVGDIDDITDVNTIGMGRGVTQDVLLGAPHLSDESSSNTSNSARIDSGELYDFFNMVNGNLDGGPMMGNLSNGDKVYFTGHVSAGAQLFEPYNTTNGNGLISQGRYNGQNLFGYTMPNVGNIYSGAVMYELGSSSRPKQMFMTGFKYRIKHVWGNGFRGDIYVFYRKSNSGYDNFNFHEKVEHPSAIGNSATTEDLILTNPTPAANAFLLVFVSNLSGNWQELLRLQLFFNEPPAVVEYPKLPPYLFMDKFTTEDGSVNLTGKVYSEHANISKVYGTTFDLDSFVSEDVTDHELITLLESSDIPANAKFVMSSINQYIPTPINETLTHTVSNRGESIPIVADMMIRGYMVVVDEEGRISRSVSDHWS